MAHPARYRAGSPGPKRLTDPMRASTGTVPLGSSYDPYESHSAARYGPDDYTARFVSRTRAEPLLEAQPISTKTYRDPGHSTRHRTEYAIRPRSRSHTVSSDLHVNPPRLVTPRSSSNRPSAVVTTYGRAPSPRSSHARREDVEKYLTPASSTHGRGHTRVYSTDYASDTGRLNPYDRAGPSRTGYGEYRAYGSRPHRRYAPVGGYGKEDGFSDEEAYSYTNPREQFEKESVARLKYQQAGRRRERPVSIAGPEDTYLRVPRPDGRPSHGPPPLSHRDFDRPDAEERLSRHHVDPSSPQHPDRYRAPVALHREADAEYSSYSEDRESGHHRHRRHHRRHGDESSRHRHADSHPRRYVAGDGIAAAAAATGLGTAVLASGYYSGESLDYDDQAGARDRHRSRDVDGVETYSRQRYLEPKDAERRRRSRRSSRRRDENESHTSGSDEHPRHSWRERPMRRQHGESDSSSSTEHGRHRRLEVGSAEVPKATAPKARNSVSPPTEVRDKASTGGQDSSGKKPITVEPAPPKETEAPPKGILKPPREKFPEDPNAVREGVAPLKDAQKRGIPPGARWTKIDRRLVNPAALEAAHERFEERPEYVIVLRVLTKEEIQAFAVMTQEIRDARYRQYRLKEKRRRREGRQRDGRPVDGDDCSSDDEDEDEDDERSTPLAIEGPPDSSKAAASRTQARALAKTTQQEPAKPRAAN